MSELEKMQEKLNQLCAQVNEVIKEIDDFNPSEYVTEDQYNEYLDDVFGVVEIAGMSYCTSHALKELDPVAYRCDFSDYCYWLDPSDFEEYQELEEKKEDIESQIEDLENEIEELENQEEYQSDE